MGNVITDCYEDVRGELAELLEDKDNLNTDKHRELSERLSTIASLACASR